MFRCEAFTLVDPESAKRQSSHLFLFALLGFEGAKAVCKMLVKLSLGVNFINILRAHFSYESAFFAKT